MRQGHHPHAAPPPRAALHETTLEPIPIEVPNVLPELRQSLEGGHRVAADHWHGALDLLFLIEAVAGLKVRRFERDRERRPPALQWWPGRHRNSGPPSIPNHSERLHHDGGLPLSS